MTIADHMLRSASNFAIRWRGASCAPTTGPDAVEVVVVLDGGGRHPEIEAWLVTGGRREPVLARQEVRCEACSDGDLLHVDVFDGPQRLLAATLDLDRGRLVYARTPLLARTGLPAGAFDPPVAERRDPSREAASAQLDRPAAASGVLGISMHASYHNHSTWSDGKDALEHIVATATRAGLPEIGISDHYVVHPEGKVYDWSIPPDRLGAYVQAVRACAADATIPVRLGVEVDWFDGCRDAIAAALAPFEFDHVIGSVHELDGMIIDGSPAAWEKITQARRDDVHRAYWVAMKGLAESGLFDIAAHLDLAKKFDFHPTIDLTAEIDAALDAIAEADLVVEINTAGWHKPCRDAYPTLDILRGCHRRGIPTTLSADAHQAGHLQRDFDKAASRLAEAGYTEIARFAGRKRTMHPLSAQG